MEFEEKDLTHDPGVLGELKRLGHMTTPVIIIGGSTIVGFDTEKIDQALRD